MKTNIEEFLAPDLGARVLDVLQRHAGRLPEEGLVAGQAVASAIDELLGTGRPVYNDIDVFLCGSQWETQTGEPFDARQGLRHLVANPVRYYAEEELDVDGYSQSLHLASRELYTVRRTRMDGMTNRVLVDWSWQVRGQETERKARSLISVFDANSVQVAVDLQTGALYQTKAYEQFLASRELRLTQAFTPIQSLLRYFKKREELGVFGNDAAHIEFVRQMVLANELSTELREQRKVDFARGNRFFDMKYLREYLKRDPVADALLPSCCESVGTGVRQMPLAFGAKYKALYDRFADKLEPYFTLTERERGKLWLLSSSAETVDATSTRPLVGAPSDAGNATTGEHAVRRFWQLSLAPGKQLTRRRALFSEFLSQISAEETRAGYEKAYCLRGDDYLAGCDSAAALSELARVTGEHAEFAWSAVSLSVGDQIDVMRMLRKAFKSYGVPDAWGICRGNSGAVLKQWLEDPAEMQNRMRLLIGSKEALYAKRLPLPAQADNIEVHELDSAYALRVEGTKMRHCVAGYAESVANERCRIVSFRKGLSAQDCATLEWNFAEARALPAFETVAGNAIHPLQLSCAQIRSFANSTPTEDLQALEAELRAELNTWLRAHPEEGWLVLKPQALAQRRDPTAATAPTKKSAAELARRQWHEEVNELF
jgi:hypothetical protein